MDVFDLAAKISLDTSVYKQSLKDAADDTESFGSKMGSAFQTLATVATTALATVSGAVIGIGTASLKQYADFEQLVGGVDTLFKESSGKIQAYADQAYKTAGVSANQYMETVTSFSASLLQSLNWDTEKAAEYANQAIIDMSDNANKMGADISMIQNAYQGFAKQNYTMLDNLKLGYGGTKTEMQRLIADANAVKEANGEMADLSINSFADIVEAIHIVQTEMGITGTTAKEASETISGSVGSAKAAWENWLIGLANPSANMIDLTDDLVFSVKTAAKNIIPRMEEIFDSLVDVFEYMTGIDVDAIGEKFGKIREKISEFRAAAGEKFAELKNEFSEFAGDAKIAFDLEGFSGVLDLITSRLTEITGFDISLFTGKLEAIARAADGFKEEGFSGLFESLIGTLNEFLGFETPKLKEKFGEIGEKIDEFVRDVDEIGLAGALDKHILKPFEEFIGLDIKGLFEDIATKVSDLARAFKEGGLTGFFEELGASQEAINTFKETFGPFGESVAHLFTSVKDLIALIPDVIGLFINLFTEFEGTEDIPDILLEDFGRIITVISGMIDFIAYAIDLVVALVTQDWAKLETSFIGIFEKIESAFLMFLDNLVYGFLNTLDLLNKPLSLLTEETDSLGVDELRESYKKWRDGVNPGDYNSNPEGWTPYPNTPNTPLSPDAGSAPMGYVQWQESGAGIASQAQIESFFAGLNTIGATEPIAVNVNIDGETAARAMYDPLSRVASQKGEVSR